MTQKEPIHASETVLEVHNLVKTYPSFRLNEVSFSLDAGKITGFIGRNGAGKSTTLNSLFRVVQPDAGTVRFFGLDFDSHQLMIKQRVGFVSGAVNFYAKKKLRTITGVTRSFYDNWDDAAYARYRDLFHLDDNKTPSQLSQGMKVKYSLALALSHHAELLILDEPTSGLDPVSRDELTDIFLRLAEEGSAIFFSTHITSDLEDCADDILYIKNGSIVAQSPLDEFIHRYVVVNLPEGTPESALSALSGKLIGRKRGKHGDTALLEASFASAFPDRCTPADLESIMVHMEYNG